MQPTKKVVLIAGEESGDIHASVLVRQLKIRFPEIEISGIGGRHMRDAGADLIYDLADYGVTGFTEVFPYLRILRKAFIAIKRHLKKQRPDLLILVDYPGFNLRLAKYAKRKLGIKIIYYISPQIWAWKGNRIHVIKECIDKMAVILPFEKTIYEKAGVPVRFVGHPLVEKMSSMTQSLATRKELQLPHHKTIIALLPGSRSNEIEKHMPILQKTALLLNKQITNLHFVIPIAGTINPQKIKPYFLNTELSFSCIQGKSIDCMASADFVIVASGTASLECALLEKPMCIIYKSSLLTYMLVMSMIRVKFLGLCNLLVNKMMVPEFLQYDCNPLELSRFILNFRDDPDQPQKMMNQLSSLKESLSTGKADCSFFELIEAELD
jgi:lipid-A-disaccharide synthase